ncbi:MAG: FtsH protease activity modulator HflK [Myxococcota bacterium]
MKRILRAGLFGLIPLLLGGAYVALGFYPVAPDEQAVVLLLGRYHHTTGPGIGWYAPGFQTVDKRRVTVTLEEEFGYRTLTTGPPPEYEDHPQEKRMLTSDANLVDVEFVVQYRIRDLKKYLFGVEQPRAVVRDVAQAVMREVVAQNDIDSILTELKGPIEIEAMERTQSVLEAYGTGIELQGVQLQDVEPPEEVKEAFADVTSAEQDGQRMINEAEGYRDAVLQQAEAERTELVNTAEAYRVSRVLEAEGEGKKFTALLSEYQRAPAVTRERIYLETLESILPGIEKIVIEEGQSERVLPYLPLGRRRAEP